MKNKLIALTVVLMVLIIKNPVNAKGFEEPIAGISTSLEALDNLYTEIKRDVPLSFPLQLHTYALSKEYKVDYELVLAVMVAESNGNINSTGRNKNGTVDEGLMQINSCNYTRLKKELGVTDFYDPYQNIKCGVFMLGGLSNKYESPHQVLMSYNMGEGGMRRLWKQGIYSSKYSRKVVNKMNELKEGKR